MVDNYNLIKEMYEYAKENNVPIMQKDGLNYLTNYITKNNIESVLEIGTAIGYSAIVMASYSKKLHVTSIERDEKRYLEAVKNVKKANLEDRITLIYKDAEELKIDEKYDLIFIDAAKAQNIKFFQKFEKNLNSNGTIITDNLNFHGLVNVDEKSIKSRNVRGLVRKIKEYVEFLKENKNYETQFYDIGDGISVSVKKN